MNILLGKHLAANQGSVLENVKKNPNFIFLTPTIELTKRLL